MTLLPAATEVGAAELVVIRSDCAAVATTSAAVAVLLAELGSVVDEFTVTVSLIAVPAAVAAFTWSAMVKVAVPAAKLGSVQRMIPEAPLAGVIQDHPAGGVMDWKFVFAGVVSVKLAPVAALGPALVTTCV